MPKQRSRKKDIRRPKSREQRRLAVIMFTDMVGYSALTQKNESQALELLEEHNRILRSVFPRFHGKEIKTIGDAFLVEFSSALDAVQCAIEIQKKLYERNESTQPERRIQIRIGLHVGDVVYKNRDVFGDGVNIASRIEPLANPGGICLSEDVARQIQNKIDLSIVRLGTGELKNIQVPVAIYKPVLPWEVQGVGAKLQFLMRKKSIWAYAAVALLLVVGSYLLVFNRPVTAQATSIAVLPFQNFGSKADDEYFVDGMTESLITDLAKLQGLFVISRNSVFQYKGKTVDVRNVGEELRVRYVLEGSVQRSGNTLRVNAQLIDAASGAHLWADRFDRELKDLFSLQDEISMRIVSALQVRLTTTEEERLKEGRPRNMEANELYWKGLALSRSRNKSDNELAIQYFRKALEVDEHFGLAHAALASALRLRYAFGYDRSPQVIEESRLHVQHALALNPHSADAMLVKGLIEREDGQLRQAIHTMEQALQASPNNEQCLFYLGNAYRDVGEYERAVEFHIRAFEHEPKYWYHPYNIWEDIRLLRQFERAKPYGEQVIMLEPRSFLTYKIRAHHAIDRGDEAEAQNALKRMLELEPDHLDSYALRGEALMRLGRLDDAERDVLYVCERDPESQFALSLALPLLLNRKKFDAAEHIIRQSLTTKPVLRMFFGTDIPSYLHLAQGIILRQRGKEPEAREALRAAKELAENNLSEFPHSAPIRSQYGLILATLGEFDRAIEEIHTARANQPSNYEHHFNLARVYALQGEKATMLEWLDRAVKLGKKDTAMMMADVFLERFASDVKTYLKANDVPAKVKAN